MTRFRMGAVVSVRIHAAFFAALLAGCANTPMTDPLPDASSIVVLNPAKPAQVDFSTAFDARRFIPIYGLGHDIYAGGVLVDIRKSLQERDFDAAILLQEALLSNLEEAGHIGHQHTIPRHRDRTQRAGPRAQPQPQRRPAGEYPGMLDLAEIPAVNGRHLFLDSQLLVCGFWAGANGDFTPKLLVHARLSDTVAKQVLLDRVFAYNIAEPNAVQLAGDENERWTSLQEMKADVPGLEQALVRGITAVATAIVDALRTP